MALWALVIRLVPLLRLFLAKCEQRTVILRRPVWVGVMAAEGQRIVENQLSGFKRSIRREASIERRTGSANLFALQPQPEGWGSYVDE